MKKIASYNYVWLAAILLSTASCHTVNKRLNRRVTLWRKDKIPYGTYYAYENLKYIFPAADIRINTNSPLSFYSDRYGNARPKDTRRKLYIIISPQVYPDRSEINAMMNFVGHGNQLFISSFFFGDSLLSNLKIKLGNLHFYDRDTDFLRLSIYNPVTYDSFSFQYPGMADDRFASSIDSEYTTILGRDASGRPDFVKFGYKGGGAIYLHFAPMAFTNFFLLHGQNKSYYDNVFSYLPSSADEVIWDDYFRYSGRSNFSALQYIFGNSSLRWAFWLVLLLFLIIYLFESKRRQRLIPTVPQLRNSSLDFVRTIGQLYFQQKDNRNLASKMATHFLDYVRTKYNLSTSILDDEFLTRLSYKTGFQVELLKELMYDMKTAQDDPFLGDDALLALNKRMEIFYKQV